jgi:glucose-6-phosphate 1-dehydrogenase
MLNNDIKLKPHIHDLSGQISPAVFTVFGATGDLSLRYIMPTLLHMDNENLLSDGFKIVVAGRRDITDAGYFKLLDEADFLPTVSVTVLNRFKSRCKYVSASFEEPETFSKLKEAIDILESDVSGHICYDRFYYFAVAPKYFSVGARALHEQGLLSICPKHKKTIRIMLEKPFGADAKSAAALNKDLHKYFTEDQIYRADHYLGKETVQNILVLRFANEFLEPIWNKKYIDHIEVSVLESDGIGKRGKTYDSVGALKDVVQNHILQLLALITMEKPENASAEALRDSKTAILKSLVKFNSQTISKNIVRGQYQVSVNKSSYLEDLEENKSDTETYVAIKTQIKNSRWSGVPIYLRTGKRLTSRIAEISIHFKENKNNVFAKNTAANVLSIYLQPEEIVSLQVNSKIPGTAGIHQANMIFDYMQQFESDTPPAYEKLFLDFFNGDQRLFIRSDEAEASWKFIDSIANNWNIKNAPIQKYLSGSEGPLASTKLIKSDNRSWRTK